MRAARELRQSHPPRDFGVDDDDEELMRAIQASQLDVGGADDDDDISMYVLEHPPHVSIPFHSLLSPLLPAFGM